MTLILDRRWLSVILLALVSAACTTTADGLAEDVAGARDLAMVAPETVGLSSERLERLDAGMRQFVEDGRLAGVVTMMARHGKTVHFSAAGTMDIESGAPITANSIFRIYSMTKPITGVAMMMLFEEGTWRLNDPVEDFVFVGMIQHRGRTVGEVQGASRNLAYQAILD